MGLLRNGLRRLFFITGLLTVIVAATGCGTVDTNTKNADYSATKTNILDDRAVGR